MFKCLTEEEVTFNDDYGIILMKRLNDNDIVNHIRDIINDIICVNFDKNYSYKHWQMVVNSFS